jgi:hypothetical protein
VGVFYFELKWFQKMALAHSHQSFHQCTKQTCQVLIQVSSCSTEHQSMIENHVREARNFLYHQWLNATYFACQTWGKLQQVWGAAPGNVGP